MEFAEIHALQHIYYYMTTWIKVLLVNKLYDCSGVGYQPPVVLSAVQGQVAGIRTVIAHVAERNSP